MTTMTIRINSGLTGAVLKSYYGVPSDGTTGQVLTKLSNVPGHFAWRDAQGSGSSGVKKVAMLVDSMGVQNQAWDISYPGRLEIMLNQNGVKCEVVTFGVNGATFYIWNNTALYGTKTALQALIDYNPDVVLVSGLANDTLGGPVRTLAQVKSDIDYTLSHLRASLPTAEIYYGEQEPYDAAHFNSTNIKNKGLPPKLMTRRTTGILAGALSPLILDDLAVSTTRDEIANYANANTYIKAKTELTGSYGLRAWKSARLGLLINDDYHFDYAGDALKACATITTLKNINAGFLSNLSDQNVLGWNNIDTIHSGFLLPSGDGYTPQWPDVYNGSGTADNLHARIRMDSWFYEYKATTYFYPTTLTNDKEVTGQYNWHIIGAKPHTEVLNAIVDHASQTVLAPFVSSGLFTDQNGDVETKGFMGNLPLPNGVYDFYLKVGNDAFGPFVLTVIAPIERNTVIRTASATLSGHRIVYADSPTTVNYANPTSYAQCRAIVGMTTGAITASTTGPIQTSGVINEPSWSWTAGQNVYLASNGQLTQTVPVSGNVMQVGVALSPTDIQLGFNFIVQLA